MVWVDDGRGLLFGTRLVEPRSGRQVFDIGLLLPESSRDARYILNQNYYLAHVKGSGGKETVCKVCPLPTEEIQQAVARHRAGIQPVPSQLTRRIVPAAGP